jgi:serine/threonine protein kinase
MGVVYRATDVSLGRTVAIKTLPRLAEGPAERLRHEARIMAGLSHAHVAVLYGIEEWRETPLLVMEHLSGGSLASRLRRAPLAPADALVIVRKLAIALDYLHRARQYHGDIKPSNIGFTADGTPKFLDFGLSRAILEANVAVRATTNESEISLVAGTPAYFSPEVAAGQEPGPALDLWALTVVLWESMTAGDGWTRFRNDRHSTAAWEAAPAELRDGVPVAIRPLLRSALAADPRSRPQTAADLLSAIDGVYVAG